MNPEKRIALGTVQFGMPYGVSNKSGQTPPEEVNRILTFAKSRGIELLDTASAYGSAEKVLGRLDLSPFRVVSKFMPPPDGLDLEPQFEESLENLNVSSLYGYLAHRPLNLLKHPLHWKSLKNFKKQGRVEKIGFSLNSPEELQQLLDAGFTPDIVQVPMNIADRRFVTIASDLKKMGCEVHARSVFLQGLFFRKPESLLPFFDPIKPLISQLQAESVHLAGALIQYALDQPDIDRVLLGVENLDQFKEDLESLGESTALQKQDVSLPEDILMPSRWPIERK